MTPRKWFWAIFTAAVVWVLVGMRIAPYRAPGSQNPRLLQRVQIGLGGIARGILWPVSTPALKAQQMIANLTPAGTSVSRRDDLEYQILLDKYNKLLEDVRINEEKYEEIKTSKIFLSRTGIDINKEVVQADLRQVSITMNACTIVINRGSQDGIRPGMPVMCNANLIGRVVNVMPVTSDVLLMSDPKFDRIQATIVRYNENGPPTAIANCIIRGKGLNNLQSDNIAKDYTLEAGGTKLIPAPMPRDRLVLTDTLGWPERAKGYVFGMITEVTEEHMSYRIKAVLTQDLQHSVGPNPNEKYQGLLVLKIDR